MNRCCLALAPIILAASPASAETCEEIFVRLLTEGNGDGPVKIHVTQDIKGAPATTNYFYQASPGHWMTEMIDPAGQPWVLTYDDAMYTSADEGQTWKKLRDLDSGGNADAAKETMKANAATTRNAVCGEEDLNGVAYDVVEADFDMLQGSKTENHHKYWVNPQNGFIDKAVYEMKGAGFESITTQVIEPAPDLDLPTPE